MSFLSIGNVKITGISACVPKEVEEVSSFPLFTLVNAESFSKTTGVERRRKAPVEVCSSDLCLKAAEKLIEELHWAKTEIECLVFVSQTPDYTLPATSVILQHRLGLSTDCYTLDISSGCSGWVDALSVISSLLSHGSMKKGLLLAGDTILKFCSETDKSTYPLFGDAGTATALEFSDKEEHRIDFTFNSDGEGSDVIIIKDGGFRNPVSEKSFIKENISEGIERSKLDLILEGMDVFSFGISKAPQSVNNLLNHFSIDAEKVDHFIFHQANKFMINFLRKKIKIEPDKFFTYMSEVGNTVSNTIPIVLTEKLKEEALKGNIILAGFGVGYSWGGCLIKII